MKGAIWTLGTVLGGPYFVFHKNIFLTGISTTKKVVLATF